jgi:hypothetical protein
MENMKRTKQNDMKKTKTHKYKKGDLVGIIKDCMADCRILRRLKKRDGQALSYVVTVERIHSSIPPEETFFGKNKNFVVRERQILLKLSA